MKILHVIPGLKNSSGPTQAVLNLAKHAKADGHDVVVAYVSERGTDPTDLPSYEFEIRPFPYQLNKKWAFSSALHKFLQHNINQFDIVHVHGIWLFPNLAVSLHGTRQKIPYIVRPAGSLDPVPLKMKGSKKGLYLRLVERKLIDKAAAIHVVSEKEALNVKALNFKAPIVNIPNGIESNLFQLHQSKEQLREILNLPKDHVLLLTIGRISPIKNLEFFGRVLKNFLSNGNKKVTYIIAGPHQHEYANSLKKYYAELGILDKCRFIGEIHGCAKIQLLNACDVFCMSSFSENFGIAALEALAAGLPVLVSQHTPWQSIQDNQAGYFLPLSEEKFVLALHQLYQDSNLRMIQSKNALQLAKDFEWSAVSAKMIQAYKEVT